MGKILEALANNDLSVIQMGKINEEYKEIQKRVCELEEDLTETLKEEQKQLLKDIRQEQEKESHVYATERFTMGYRLATLIFMEVLEEHKTLLVEENN